MDIFSEVIIRRFWEKVNKNGPVPAHCPELGNCWLWTASTTGGKRPYGKVWTGEREIKAHRFAYILEHGEIPEGMLICHRCDTELCCRGTHLFAGTGSDNTRDSLAKGRWKIPNLRGEEAGQSKLTEAQVRDIKRLCQEANYPQTQIARLFGVGQHEISRIHTGKRWAHVI